MKKIIIDTDGAIDDLLALILALKSEGLNTIGITTVSGVVSAKEATRNVLRLFKYFNSSGIPVVEGANIKTKRVKSYTFETGLPNTGLSKISQDNAIKFLSQTFGKEPEKVTLVCLGPLTNIALFLKNKPNLKRKIERLYVMGGAVFTKGNATPYAEYNFYSDPEAAQTVLDSGCPITLVSLDVTKYLKLPSKFLKGKGRDKFINKILEEFGNKKKLHDPLAMAVTIDNTICKTKKLGLEIKTKRFKGQVQVIENKNNADFCWAVNSRRFFDLLERTLIGT